MGGCTVNRPVKLLFERKPDFKRWNDIVSKAASLWKKWFSSWSPKPQQQNMVAEGMEFFQ